MLLSFEMLLVSLLGLKVFGVENPGNDGVELKRKEDIKYGSDHEAQPADLEKPKL